MMQSLTESLVLALPWAARGAGRRAVGGGRDPATADRARRRHSVLVFTDWRTLGVTLSLAIATGMLVGARAAHRCWTRRSARRRFAAASVEACRKGRGFARRCS